MKCKKKYIVIVVLLLVLLTLGISYGYFTFVGGQDKFIRFRVGECLDITITEESDAIGLSNIYPVTNEEGLNYTPYTFTIKNSCSKESNYQISLESILRSDTTLDVNYIKASLEDSEGRINTNLLGSLPETDLTLSEGYDSRKLYSGILEGQAQTNFKLRLWLDYDATKEDAANKSHTSKIVVSARSDEALTDEVFNITYTENSSVEGYNGYYKSYETITSIEDTKDNNITAKYCVSNTKCTPNINATLSDITTYSRVSNNIKTFTYNHLNGESMICTQARDSKGNRSVIRCSELIKIDTEAPSINYVIEEKTDGVNNWYQALKIRLEGIDNKSGVKNILYCTTTEDTCTPNIETTNNPSVIIEKNSLAQKICSIVRDNNDNVSEVICSNTYKVDTKNPEVSITYPVQTAGSNGWYKALSVKGTASDTESNIAHMKYCTTTSTICTPNEIVTGSEKTVALSSNASAQKVCYEATDNSGRSSGVICSNTYKVDEAAPNSLAISGGTTLKATSQSVTLTAKDNIGITSYYFGTSTTAACNTSITSTTNMSISKSITSAGTYTLRVCDAAGNQATTSISIVQYTVRNVLNTVAGAQGTYTSGNYAQVSSNNYIVKSGTTLTLTSLYTVPSSSNANKFMGYSTTYGSSAASLSKTNPSASATTYTMYFNRNIIQVAFHADGGTIQTSAGGYTWALNTYGYITRNNNPYFFTLKYGTTALDLPNWNNSGYINLTKSGYTAISGAEWKHETSGKTFSHAAITIGVNDLCNATSNDCNAHLKINWQSDFKLMNTILNNNGGKAAILAKGNPNFKVGTSNGAMYAADDDYTATTKEKSYYFRGSVTNNYVRFAGYWWKILRINGDGSVRIIFDGTSANHFENTRYDNLAEAPIPSSIFSNRAWFSEATNAWTYVTTTNYDVEAKKSLDSWYNTNISNKGYATYLSENSTYCGDENVSIYIKSTSPYYSTNYFTGWYNRKDGSPSLKCSLADDLYSPKSSNYGNKILTNPVGLVSADELMYAGMLWSHSTPSNYLGSINSFWTLTQYGVTLVNPDTANPRLKEGFQVIFHTENEANSYNYKGGMISTIIDGENIDNSWLQGISYSKLYLRPVLNLKPTVNFTLTGSGTPGSVTNPYIIQ